MPKAVNMTRLQKSSAAALLLLAGAGLSAPALAQNMPSGLPAEPAASAAVLDNGVLYRELTRGIYEVRYNPGDDALYVASALAIPGVKGGIVYKLNADTLEPVGAIHTDRGNFALALNADGSRLYATNSLEHSVTAFNLEDNSIIGRLDLNEVGPDGNKFGPRQVIHDAAKGALYIGAVGDPGVIWVVDADTLQLRHTIREAGKWVTGLAVHPRTGDLYAANGGGEILVIDTASYAIKRRFRPAGDAEALLLNFAFDVANNRLYVTDHSKLKTVLIVNPDTGEKIGEIPDAGESMAILLHPQRRELYVTNRERGTVSVWDADTHALKRTVRAGPNPNSLALSADGQTLFVTVKTPFTSTYSASGVESIVRIPLDVAAPPAAPRP